MPNIAPNSKLPLSEEIGHIAGIPVRNLWLLMLYASHLFQDLERANVAVEENPDDIPDLVAEMLCRQIERRIKRNLSHGYQSREAILDRVRGRIDLLKTERHRLLDRGKVACRFDELTINTARNCYVRAALEDISKIVNRRELAYRCRSLATGLRRMGVTGERPGQGNRLIDRFGRHDAGDQPMVTAANLAFNLALPTEIAGDKNLSMPDRENTKGWLLFEKGIAGFYDVVLSEIGWRVQAGKTLHWPSEQKSPGINKILPSMKTDIVLDHLDQGRRIVIDTKFTSVLKSGQYRKESLKSEYLYQMYAYLRSQEGIGDPLAEQAMGLLLHPSVGEMVDEHVVFHNHELRFVTVDLAMSAQEIRQRLLHIIGV